MMLEHINPRDEVIGCQSALRGTSEDTEEGNDGKIKVLRSQKMCIDLFTKDFQIHYHIWSL